MTVLAHRALRLLVAAAAALFSAAFLWAALARAFFPYDLDFLEDSTLIEALRFGQGRPVFGPPSAVFTPLVYTPLYPWAGGWLMRLAGTNFAVLRLFSLAVTLATAALIYWIVQRETGLRWLGIACAGLYLGGYRLNGYWYGAARVDPLFVALMLGGLAIGIYAGGSRRGLIASALVLSLAFFTKQNGLLSAAGLAVYLLAAHGRPAWWFVISFVALTLIPFEILNLATHGWLGFYTFPLPAAEPIELGRFAHFFRVDLLGLMTGLTLMALAAAGLAVWRRLRSGFGGVLEMIREQPWLVVIGIGAALSATSRARVGGNVNDLMPVYACLCLAPAVLWRNWPGLARAPRWGEILISLALLLLFGLDRYDPRAVIPRPELRQSGDRLIRRIASYDGEVLVMMHPYYALLAGKEPSAQVATIWYTFVRGGLPLPDDFVTRIKSKYYAAIISDESSFETEPAIRDLIDANYILAETLDPAEAPATDTGVVVQPRVIYLPARTDGYWEAYFRKAGHHPFGKETVHGFHRYTRILGAISAKRIRVIRILIRCVSQSSCPATQSIGVCLRLSAF